MQPDPLEHQLLGRHGAIIGVDEAGRGCLAGPVYVAAVLVTVEQMHRLLAIPHLNDSKKLSPSRREMILEQFLDMGFTWRASVIVPRIIDRINVLEASRLGMKRSVERIPTDGQLKPIVAVDGNQPIEIRYPQQTVVKGDSRFKSIAMASIIAKVLRDRYMTAVDRVWPQYGFSAHKGYPAPEHKAALLNHGPCPIHRLSYRGVLPNPHLPF